MMGLDKTYRANTVELLEVNFKGEKEAIDFYKQICQKVNDNKKAPPYVF
jgi:rubrerythrin